MQNRRTARNNKATQGNTHGILALLQVFIQSAIEIILLLALFISFLHKYTVNLQILSKLKGNSLNCSPHRIKIGANIEVQRRARVGMAEDVLHALEVRAIPQ